MRRSLFAQLSWLLLITGCFMQVARSYPLPNVNRPRHVKKIYIEPTSNVEEEIKIDRYLKAELGRHGFIIVNDASEADAVLSLVAAQGEIVLHGDGDVPHKSIYLYQLTLPGKEAAWKAKIKFVSKPSYAEENMYVARKIAEKIAKKFGAK